MSMKKSHDTIGNRSRDLPVCSAVPQPLRHRVPQAMICLYIFNMLLVMKATKVWKQLLHEKQKSELSLHSVIRIYQRQGQIPAAPYTLCIPIELRAYR
jgi:hypothetical protein